MDPDAQTLLARFGTLSTDTRRVIYHGIMDRLRRDEWRELKDRAAGISFDCDLVGQSPVEIVALIAEHMQLSDIILLRRVSRRWRLVLTSPLVCSAAIRATVGGSISISDPTLFIKRRLRLERGLPSHKIQLPSPLSSRHDTFMKLRGVGYFDGIYAWLEGTDGRTSVALLNLWTGRLVRLTTDNREQLVELRMSKELVAAVSTRGYCHVWNINTEEHKDFRLSSLKFRHFLVNGTKVALSYRDYLVHWGFNTEIARTIQIRLDVVTLALHPTEDEFTVICLDEQENHDNREQTVENNPPGTMHAHPNLSRMHTETFALDSSNEFHPFLSRLQELPIYYGSVGMVSYPQEICVGQSTILLKPTATTPAGEASPALYLTLDSGKDIVLHSLPPHLFKITNLVFLEKGVVYAPTTSKDFLVILKSSEANSLSPSENSYMSWSKDSAQRNAPCMNCHWMFGDSDFVVLVNLRYVEIWGFSEIWDFSRIASIDT